MTRSDGDLDSQSVYEETIVDREGKESFLQLLVDNVSNGILAIDTESQIVFANPTIEEIFGYDPDDLVGQPLTVLIPERLHDRHLEAIERYIATGERSLDWDRIELPGLHRNGREIPLEISFREVDQNGRRLFTGIVSDVTAQRRAENERRLLYSTSRAVAEAENFDDGLVAAIQQVCNLTAWDYGEAWVESPDGEYLVRTAAPVGDSAEFEQFRESSGMTEVRSGNGLPGRVSTNKDAVWIADLASVSEAEFERTESASSVGFRTALGIPIEHEDEVVAVLLFCMRQRRDRDDALIETLETVASELGQLVARRRAEQQLQQEREVIQRVLETSPVGIYTVDRDGRTIQMNSRAQEFLGIPLVELEGRPYERPGLQALGADGDPLPTEDHPVVRVTRSGEAVDGFEHQLESRDGTRRWLSANAVPIFDADDELSQVVVSLSDITERKTYERELERRRQELQSELDEVLERISDAMFALDTEWRFTYVNERAEQLLRRPEDELKGMSFWDAFSEAVDTTFQAEFEQAMDTQEPVAFEEYYDPTDSWYEVNAYPSPSGLSVYFHDISDRKQYERGLTTLHTATQDLVSATDDQRVCELAVETAEQVLKLTGAGVYLFDQAAGVLRPAAFSDALRDVLGEVPQMNPGEGIAGKVFIDDSPAVFDDVRESEHVYNPGTPIRSEIIVPLDEYGVFIAASTETGAFDERTRALVEILATTTETTLGRLEDELDLRERERELRETNRQLKQLARVNELIRHVHRVLVEATTRQEMDESVCRQLVDSEPISFAWIGELDPDTADVSPRAWAGGHQDYLDRAFSRDEVFQREPARQTATTNEVTVVKSVAAGLRSEPWRQEGLTRGFQSVISVPLRYDEFSYGTLTVYASVTDFFDELTKDVFEELGRDIANGINAVETKQGLLFDRVVQIEVQIENSDDVLHRLAAAVEGEVEFEGLVPQTESSLVFFSTERQAVDRIEAVADERLAVERVRLINDEHERCQFEMVVTGSLVASQIADIGGVLRSLVSDGTELRAIIDLPHSVDVRGFIERLRTNCPGAELIARRELERSVETRQGFQSQLKQRLTDRQLEVLRTTYLAGFFDDPRGSTGREIGQALGISQPTVNAHLRAAQRRIFSMLFDDDSTRKSSE